MDDEGIHLELSCLGSADGPMEWMLHSVRNRQVLGDWSKRDSLKECGVLTLTVAPRRRALPSANGIGLSYEWSFQSLTHRIFKITDRATWEPGGSIVGRSFWMRNAFAPCRPVFQRETSYSTEWYLPTCLNPDIFQFLPFQTQLQGFTFTVSPRGVLVTFSPVVGHIRSIFEKERGSTYLSHWHEHCRDLSADFASYPMEVLWFAGKRSHHENVELYVQVRDMVEALLHADAGLRREKAVSYALIEEWSLPDMVSYRTKVLPEIHKYGVRRVSLANHFKNNMNTFGVANMCCTVDWKVAPHVGEKNLADFVREAERNGMSVEMWGNTAVSLLALQLDSCVAGGAPPVAADEENELLCVVRKAKQPWVRDAGGGIEADHYRNSFAVLNLRDPTIASHWMACWKRLKESTGISGIFWDSSFNLSGDHFHYSRNICASRTAATMDQTQLLGALRPEQDGQSAIESQYLAHLALVGQMQKEGFSYCGEDCGVFGTHRSGPGCVSRAESMFMWNEFICPFDPRALIAAGLDPARVFFEGLAWRNLWMLYWDFENQTVSFTPRGGADPLCRPTRWHTQLLNAFDLCGQAGFNLEVLPSGLGVFYRRGEDFVRWCFRTLTVSIRVASNGETRELVIDRSPGLPKSVSSGKPIVHSKRDTRSVTRQSDRN
ncbi:hypothetical protein [Thermaurantiacus sp.]